MCIMQATSHGLIPHNLRAALKTKVADREVNQLKQHNRILTFRGEYFSQYGGVSGGTLQSQAGGARASRFGRLGSQIV